MMMIQWKYYAFDDGLIGPNNCSTILRGRKPGTPVDGVVIVVVILMIVARTTIPFIHILLGMIHPEPANTIPDNNNNKSKK